VRLLFRVSKEVAIDSGLYLLMHRLFLLSVVFLNTIILAPAQDTLLLMNGSDLPCTIVEDSGTVFLTLIRKPSGRIIFREIHKNDVFSVTKAGDRERVLYMQDEMLGNVYSIDEMRFYLAGENDARQHFSAWPTFAVGFVLCVGAAIWGGDGYITTVAPPILYTLVQLIPKIKIREKTMSHPEYKYNDMYADGFEPPARTRKLLRAMEGGFLGSTVGVVYWLLFIK
jgi:hypothetical protein